MKTNYNEKFRNIFYSVLMVVAGFFGYTYHEDVIDSASTVVEQVTDTVTDVVSPSTTAPVAEPVEKEQSVVVPEVIVKDDDVAKILNVKPYYLLVQRYDGKVELRTGGTNSWRYNNPGKILHGNFSRAHGAIGSDGKYAIFPNYELGRAANETLLFDSDYGFKSLTVEAAITKYAPSSDGYKTATYVKNVASAVGISASTKLSDLSESQRTKFIDAIEKEEVFLKGVVTIFKDHETFLKEGW